MRSFSKLLAILAIVAVVSGLEPPVPSPGAVASAGDQTAKTDAAQPALVEAEGGTQTVAHASNIFKKKHHAKPHHAKKVHIKPRHHIAHVPKLRPHWELDPLRKKMEAEILNLENRVMGIEAWRVEHENDDKYLAQQHHVAAAKKGIKMDHSFKQHFNEWGHDERQSIIDRAAWDNMAPPEATRPLGTPTPNPAPKQRISADEGVEGKFRFRGGVSVAQPVQAEADTSAEAEAGAEAEQEQEAESAGDVEADAEENENEGAEDTGMRFAAVGADAEAEAEASAEGEQEQSQSQSAEQVQEQQQEQQDQAEAQAKAQAQVSIDEVLQENDDGEMAEQDMQEGKRAMAALGAELRAPVVQDADAYANAEYDVDARAGSSVLAPI